MNDSLSGSEVARSAPDEPDPSSDSNGQRGLIGRLIYALASPETQSEKDLAFNASMRQVLPGLTNLRRLRVNDVSIPKAEIVAVPVEELDFNTYEDLNAQFHLMLAELSGSRIVQREIEHVKQLPFAGPSAFLNAQTDIPAFRASLVIGQAHHRAIAHAIEMREGSRAEALGREHARLARQNLDFVMKDTALIERVPGLRLVST